MSGLLFGVPAPARKRAEGVGALYTCVLSTLYTCVLSVRSLQHACATASFSPSTKHLRWHAWRRTQERLELRAIEQGRADPHTPYSRALVERVRVQQSVVRRNRALMLAGLKLHVHYLRAVDAPVRVPSRPPPPLRILRNKHEL